MPGLISNAEAASLAREFFADLSIKYATGGVSVVPKSSMEKLLDWVEHMCDAAPAAEWIPVGDRLPEARVPTILGHSDGTVMVGYLDSAGQWRLLGGSCMVKGAEAWQPLPAPYQPPRKVPTEPGWWWYRSPDTPHVDEGWYAVVVFNWNDELGFTVSHPSGRLCPAPVRVEDSAGTWGDRIEEPDASS